jgi:hypothetical protein
VATSDVVESQLASRFPGAEQRNEARQLLPVGLKDVVLRSLIALSEGSLVRLGYFADRARLYPSDVVFLASYPSQLGTMPRRLRKILIEGGQVEEFEPGPFPRGTPNLDQDLWIRSEYGPDVICVVCRKLVHRDPNCCPQVSLSRSPTGMRQAKRVVVHTSCFAAGEAVAGHQGYGWKRAGRTL